MTNNQNWDAEKEQQSKLEEPSIEEWRIHAIARRLEESMQIKARPEFESELRNRLLTNFDQHRQTGSRVKTYSFWNLSLIPASKSLPGLLLLGIVILALTAMALLNLDTDGADKTDNSTRTPILTSQHGKSMYVGLSRTAKMEIAEANFEPVITGKDVDEYELQWQHNKSKNTISPSSADSSNKAPVNSKSKRGPTTSREIFIL
jgi:hypothetical protein